MDKRGSWVDSITGHLIEIVLVLGYMVALTMIVTNMYSSTLLEKKLVAADSAILTDFIYASPGNVMHQYQNNLQGFVTSFEENYVIVYGKGDDALPGSQLKYRFGEDRKIPFKYSVFFSDGRKKDESIAFLKTSNMVKPDLSANIKRQELRQTKEGNASKGAGRSILVDTQDDNGDKRAKSAAELTGYFGSLEATSYFTYIDLAKNEEQRSIGMSNKPDIYLVVEASGTGREGAFVVINNRSSLNLGMSIASKLSSLSSFKGAAVAIDPNDLMLRRAPIEAARIIINGDHLSVQKNRDAIGKAIITGIMVHNG